MSGQQQRYECVYCPIIQYLSLGKEKKQLVFVEMPPAFITERKGYLGKVTVLLISFV